MSTQPPDEEDVDHAEVARRDRESIEPVGPASGYGRTITIAGFVVAIAAILWVIFASGYLL